MKKALVFLITVLLAIAFIGFSGCLQPDEGKEIVPPTKEKEFLLSFKFGEGSALFHKITLTIERNGKTEPIQVMETVSLVKESQEDFSELQMIMLNAYRLDSNGRKDMCASMPYSRKKGTVKFYLDGKVDYGEFTKTSFHLPQEKLKLGDSWEFEGIEYKIEEETRFKNEAGEFNCLKISFDGIKYDYFGTKRIHGYFLFDPEKNLKVKEETINERPTLKTKSENELIRIVPDFSEEIDYSCVFAAEKLSPEEKFELAEKFFAENEYEGSLELALSAKQDLEEKSELSQGETSLMKKALTLIADSYQFKGDKERELTQRFENAKYFEQFLTEKTVLVSDFVQAYLDYKKVSESESNLAKEASERFNDLNARMTGILKGNANLADTGKVEGLKILLVEGIMELEYESEPFNTAYSIPVLDLSKGNLFSALYYRAGYKPIALPPITIDENTFLGEYSVVLKRMDDNSLGYLAGFCYSLEEETGLIKQFNDLNFKVSNEEQEFEAQCSNGFYSIPLKPGPYTIEPIGKEVGVKQAGTTIANIVQ